MLKQELESVEFYIEQGYADIARDTLDMLERQYGQHPEIGALRARLAATEEEPAAQTEDPSAAFDMGSAFDPSPAPAASDTHVFDAAGFDTPAVFAEPEAPAVFEAPPPAPQPPPQAASNNSRPKPAPAGIDPGLAAIFDEFREAVEDDDGDEESGGDFDTHYQMGLAYREMGLLDQAVEEFQTAAAQAAPGDGTPRFLQCCNMLGHCFMEKGMPRPAALWFKKGLQAPGHTRTSTRPCATTSARPTSRWATTAAPSKSSPRSTPSTSPTAASPTACGNCKRLVNRK
jgi:tetratricopeptide (TPR) repeat protein